MILFSFCSAILDQIVEIISSFWVTAIILLPRREKINKRERARDTKKKITYFSRKRSEGRKKKPVYTQIIKHDLCVGINNLIFIRFE